MKRGNFLFHFLVSFALYIPGSSIAQPITGVWKGRINNKRVEVKLVQKGDSITGTSYYPGLLKGYRRYSVKGYFDGNNNSIVWWDDQLIFPKEKDNGNDRPYFSADYNCPGGSRMFLTSDPRNKKNSTIDLSKANGSSYRDEWDFVIDNYKYGANDPRLIDSVSMIAFTPVKSPTKLEFEPQLKAIIKPKPEVVVTPQPAAKEDSKPKAIVSPQTVAKTEPKAILEEKPKTEIVAPPKNEPLVFLERRELENPKQTVDKPIETQPLANNQPERKSEESVLIERKAAVAEPGPAIQNEKPIAKVIETKLPAIKPENVEKFETRVKKLALEVPVSGDSIEIKFYDNAEVDGDSISLFLNDQLIFEHIRLTSYAYTIKLPVKELKAINELVMLAENLGSIPPNTAYMIIMVGDKKYDAQIVSTETSSALIRLRKE